jgi:hypothetical protein
MYRSYNKKEQQIGWILFYIWKIVLLNIKSAFAKALADETGCSPAFGGVPALRIKKIKFFF